MSAPHQLIRASAGTGKTFRLTHRLVALLAQGVPPERVLASTFTRRAAGEILQRLVARLAEAATDARARAEANAHLAAEPGAPQLDEPAARRLLLAVLRQLHRVEVRTLDAFFHQLARVHAWELDLPPGWTLAARVDEARLQSDAVSRVLARSDGAELSALLALLAGGPPRRSVHADLLQHLKDAQGLLADGTPAAWEAVGAPEPVPAAELARAAAITGAAAAPLTKAGRPRVNWVKNLDALRAAAQSSDWAALQATGLSQRVAEDGTEFDGVPIPIPLADALRVLLRAAAVAALERDCRRVQAFHRLLRDYDVAFTELQHERRLLRFEDVPRALLRGGVPGGDEAVLALRLDGAPEHVLLDEFQDTSAAQWRVAAPLVDRARAVAGRHVLVVGDAKQSIYGWRGGEPRLMEALARRNLEPASLDRSRRSAPAVIAAVNAVFGGLAESPALGDEPAVRAAARSWHGAARFPRHDTARTDLAGAVRLWQVDTPDPHVGPRAERLAEATADLVRRLALADSRARIGVLVRRNRPIPRLIHELRRRGVLASGEGGNPLADSEAVRVLLSLLRLADHPGDTAAAFHVGTSPLADGLAAAGLRVDPRPSASHARVAAAVREALQRDGYGAFLQARREQVDACAALGAWDRRRAAQLVDLGHAWDARATLRPADFVAHVRSTPVEDPAAARVRVLTVHAAKGLEFDAVVCPELERDPSGRHGEAGLVAGRSDPEQPLDAIFLDVQPDLARRAGHARLLRLLDEVRERDLREELCVLYVALTRARRRLDLLVSTADAPEASFAAILRHALPPQGLPGQGAPDPVPPARSVLLHVLADPGAAADPLLDAGNAPEPLPPAGEHGGQVVPATAAASRLVWRAGGAAHVLRRSAPSSREGGGRVRAPDLLQRGAAPARLRGVLVHEWMSGVTWLDEPLPAEGTWREAARRRLLRDGHDPACAPVDDWLAWLRASLARREAVTLLSRGPAAARAVVPASAVPELWRERAFLLVDRQAGEEVLVPGAFDRVVLWRDAAGAPLAAEVVDFKTDDVGEPGAPDAARLDARAAHYAPQMQAYRRALGQMTGLPPGRITARLLFLGADVVRDVPPEPV
jgi:ATP-dependent exoDNAse (exonuclease V) beta subunit